MQKKKKSMQTAFARECKYIGILCSVCISHRLYYRYFRSRSKYRFCEFQLSLKNQYLENATVSNRIACEIRTYIDIRYKVQNLRWRSM